MEISRNAVQCIMRVLLVLMVCAVSLEAKPLWFLHRSQPDVIPIRHIQDVEEECDIDRTTFACFSTSGRMILPCPSDVKLRPHTVTRVTRLIRVELLDEA